MSQSHLEKAKKPTPSKLVHVAEAEVLSLRGGWSGILMKKKEGQRFGEELYQLGPSRP